MKEESISNVIEEQISGEWGEDGDGVSVLRSTNFTNEGRLNLENVVQRAIDKKKIEKKRLVIGDSIIEKSGGSPDQPVGRVVYFDIQDGVFLCNNFTSILRPKKEVHPRYFFWFLFYNHQIKRTLKYQNKTTGIINLQLTRYLEDTKIPLPTFIVQQKIAAILDKVDSLRQKDKHLLKLYDDLAQNVFYEMFGNPVRNEKGWDVKPIKELAENIFLGLTSRVDYVNDGGFPLVRATDIRDGKLSFERVRYISESQHKLITKNRLTKRGDLLISKSGSLGTCAIVNTEQQFTTYESIITVQANPQLLDNNYLMFLIRNSNFQVKILGGKVGGTVSHLNLQMFRNIEMPTPPIDLQQKFSKIIEIYKTLHETCLTGSIKTENLYGVLLQRAFKGELVKE